MPTYAPDSTLRAARAAYFAANGFDDDGGYGKRWEVIKLGPVPIPIRNVPARVKAIRFHDLHHLLTGYTTTGATGPGFVDGAAKTMSPDPRAW